MLMWVVEDLQRRHCVYIAPHHSEDFVLAFPGRHTQVVVTSTTTTRGGAEWVMRGPQTGDLRSWRRRVHARRCAARRCPNLPRGKILRLSNH